jgi:DNA polymerase III delta subunit
MLYALYGTDRDKVLIAQRDLLARVKEENPGIEVFSLSEENYSPEELQRYIGSTGLFSSKHVVTLLDVLSHDEYGESVFEQLPEMADSENIFIIRDGKLKVKEAKACMEHAEECIEFTVPKGAEEKPFSVFSLTDALGNRDKKSLWILYQEALREGHVAEEIHGLLVWQMKTLVQIAKGATKDMKPYVLGKGKRSLANYKDDEATDKLFELTVMYHEARRGGLELSVALERFILAL